MKCPKCQAESPEGDQFCRKCGTKLMQTCLNCGASNSPQYIFCGNCGHRLAPPLAPVPTAKPTEPAPPAETPKPIPTEEISEPIPTEKPTASAPEEREEVVTFPRVPTGIEGLDQLIGGGFLPGKVYLVSGESGTGKTIFGLQYIYHGLSLGENGIIVSGDEKPSHLMVDAEFLGWGLDRYVKERKLGLLDVSPYFTDIRAGKKKDADVGRLVTDLAKQVKKIGAKRVVIDPIAPLVFGQESSALAQEYVRDLIYTIEDNLECTVLITSGILSGTASLSRYNVEEFVSEGVIVLGMAMRKTKRVRTLYLRKIRGAATDLDDHVFDILPHRGIVIRE
jgi:circadian clock protein KaiC